LPQLRVFRESRSISLFLSHFGEGMTARNDIGTTERMKCHEGRKIEGLLIACEWKQPGADIKVSQKQVHDPVDEIGIPTVWLSRRVLSR